MIGQMTIYDLMPERTFDPLREVARRATPYWTTSWRDLAAILKTCNCQNEWAAAVKHEFSPYGHAGHYGCSGRLIGWNLNTDLIEITFRSENIKDLRPVVRKYSWSDFAEEIAKRIMEGDYNDRSDR